MSHHQTVDITPSWRSALKMNLLLIERGDQQCRAAATEELTRMADLADRYVKVCTSLGRLIGSYWESVDGKENLELDEILAIVNSEIRV